jgi:hypothetical protein
MLVSIIGGIIGTRLHLPLYGRKKAHACQLVHLPAHQHCPFVLYRACTARRRVNPLALLGSLRPSNLAKALQAQRQNLQRLVWRLEDASVFTAKFASRALLKAARPALVCERPSRGGEGLRLPMTGWQAGASGRGSFHTASAPGQQLGKVSIEQALRRRLSWQSTPLPVCTPAASLHPLPRPCSALT